MSTIHWVRLSLKVYPTTRKEIHDEIVKFEENCEILRHMERGNLKVDLRKCFHQESSEWIVERLPTIPCLNV